MTAWNVWARAHLDADLYDHIWTQLDLAQAAMDFEVLVYFLAESTKRAQRYTFDAMTIALCFLHMLFWVVEYQAWLPHADETGWMLYWMRKWVNVLMIVSVAVSMYHRTERNRRSWRSTWQNTRSSILIRTSPSRLYTQKMTRFRLTMAAIRSRVGIRTANANQPGSGPG